MIHISSGNIKVPFANISLPPEVTCREDAPCTKECYAKKAWKQYPIVRHNWSENYELYRKDDKAYFRAIESWILLNNPKYFRFHVSGDIPDHNYLCKIIFLAKKLKGTRFLVHTKRVNFIRLIDRRKVPTNLVICLSTWPDEGTLEAYKTDVQNINPGDYTFPMSFLKDDPRIPKSAFICPGHCGECGAKCWYLKPKEYVVFKRH
jgi:hypothetical protein